MQSTRRRRPAGSPIGWWRPSAVPNAPAQCGGACPRTRRASERPRHARRGSATTPPGARSHLAAGRDAWQQRRQVVCGRRLHRDGHWISWLAGCRQKCPTKSNASFKTHARLRNRSTYGRLLSRSWRAAHRGSACPAVQRRERVRSGEPHTPGFGSTRCGDRRRPRHGNGPRRRSTRVTEQRSTRPRTTRPPTGSANSKSTVEPGRRRRPVSSCAP